MSDLEVEEARLWRNAQAKLEARICELEGEGAVMRSGDILTIETLRLAMVAVGALGDLPDPKGKNARQKAYRELDSALCARLGAPPPETATDDSAARGEEQVGAPLDLTREEAVFLMYAYVGFPSGETRIDKPIDLRPREVERVREAIRDKLRAFLAGAPPEEDADG